MSDTVGSNGKHNMGKARMILQDVLGDRPSSSTTAQRNDRRKQAPHVEMTGEKAQTFIVQGNLYLYMSGRPEDEPSEDGSSKGATNK